MATDPLELETRQSQILTQKSIEADEAKDIEQSQFPYPDQDLQLSRRLDWRFLLPNPHLGRVGYLGPSGGTLPRALLRVEAALNRLTVEPDPRLDRVTPSEGRGHRFEFCRVRVLT